MRKYENDLYWTKTEKYERNRKKKIGKEIMDKKIRKKSKSEKYKEKNEGENLDKKKNMNEFSIFLS